MSTSSAGEKFRSALAAERPLQIAGVINAYVALMAKEIGYRAIYLSGSGVAASSYGLPDLGMTTLDNVLEDVRRITDVVDLPLLVDIDTAWGGRLMVARTIKQMEKAGCAAVHMEDQVGQKRCGHRDGKVLVSCDEMRDRLHAALDARTDPNFVIMARTDALGVEGPEKAVERAKAYEEAGADMIFAEACRTLEDYQMFRKAVKIPILANITEFGKTPLFSREELGQSGVDMVLYPLSANRAMNRAAEMVLKAIRQEGCQESCLKLMQSREELYNYLKYHEVEAKLDQVLASNGRAG